MFDGDCVPAFGGRRILVTGGSRGIGRAIVELLAARGAQMLVLARNHQDVRRCVAMLPGDGHRGLAMDVSDQRAWEAAAAAGMLSGVDGLVVAAAVLAPVGPVGAYTPDEFWQTMRVNVLGVLLAVDACVGSLSSASGAVVTFGGAGAASPLPRYDAYATSKAAVARLTENLSMELSTRGVRVNAVSPGFVATSIHDATLEAGFAAAGEHFAATRDQLRAGGVPARHAAELTAFLLGPQAHAITGRLISAQWDPWREPSFQQRLRDEPDLARIRRIDGQFFAPVDATG